MKGEEDFKDEMVEALEEGIGLEEVGPGLGNKTITKTEDNLDEMIKGQLTRDVHRAKDKEPQEETRSLRN